MFRNTTAGRPASLGLFAVSLLIFLTATGPASARQTSGQGPAAQGDGASWLETEMAREVQRPLPTKSFRLSDVIGGSVPAKLGAKTYDEAETVHSFELDFGADQAARCFLWETELSVAGLLDRQTQQVQSGLGENAQWRILGFDADAAGGVPLLGIRWLYQIETETRTNVGLFKMYAAPVGSATTLCFHDRLGYVESFGSLFRALVAGLEVPPSDEPTPDVRDVSVITMFDMKVGYVEDSLTFDGDQVQVVSESALLVPTSASEILSSDEATVELSDLEGRLISAVLAEGPFLEISTRLEVMRAENGEWIVAGVHEGEDFEATFSGDPMSNYGTLLMTRRALADLSSPVSFPIWDDNEPGKLSTATITIQDAGPPTRATMSLQGLEARATLDAQGRAVAIRMETDGVEVAIDRVFTQGSVPRAEPTDAPPE